MPAVYNFVLLLPEKQ